jgi:hydrogenase maturation protease
MKKTLLYGYGNPGRQDDALGVMLVNELELWAKSEGLDWISIDSNYQLNIEDAATISEFDRVIFADASKEENINSFLINDLKPSAQVEFTMHAVAPAFILHLCESIYDKQPEAWLLHIRGYEWELQEGLTLKAAQNLEKAIIELKKFIFTPIKSSKF